MNKKLTGSRTKVASDQKTMLTLNSLPNWRYKVFKGKEYSSQITKNFHDFNYQNHKETYCLI